MGTTSAAKVEMYDGASCEADRHVTKCDADLSDHLGAVLRRYDVTKKEVADWWTCDVSFVSLVLSGQRNLTDTLITKLPEWLQIALHAEWAGQLKVLVGRRAALIQALEALNAMAREEERPRARMAKADLTAEKKERHG